MSVSDQTDGGVAHLEIKNVSLRFGGTLALQAAEFDAARGKVIGIVGPNGAGKTSLLNCINGFYRPHEGEIRFEGTSITGLRPSKIARLGIGRTFQNVELFKESTVLDNIMLGRHMMIKQSSLSAALHFGRARREEAANREAVEEIIEFLGIEHLRKRVVAGLPWGLQKMVEIGRAIATEPRLLMLDEPTAGMNQDEKAEVTEAILRMKNDMGVTQLLIEHDMRFVFEICDEIVVLDYGEVIAQGPPDAIVQDQRVIEAYLGTGALG